MDLVVLMPVRERGWHDAQWQSAVDRFGARGSHRSGTSRRRPQPPPLARWALEAVLRRTYADQVCRGRSPNSAPWCPGGLVDLRSFAGVASTATSNAWNQAWCKWSYSASMSAPSVRRSRRQRRGATERCGAGLGVSGTDPLTERRHYLRESIPYLRESIPAGPAAHASRRPQSQAACPPRHRTQTAPARLVQPCTTDGLT